MNAELSLAQELELEKACRAIMKEENVEGIRKLCASLVRTHVRQQKFLEKSVLRVSELEILAFLLSEAKESDLPALRENARDLL